MARRARKGFSCGSCGQPLSFGVEGNLCGDCNRPTVVLARRALSAVRRADREVVVTVETDTGHGPGLCEDAPACAVCREHMGLPVTLPGLG